jgi:DNA-binding LacI/PurR family transcriptional regulator
MTKKPVRRPTITNVAAEAGVAATTVSRVFNGGYVSAEARARVEKAIKSLGYVPSSTARSLRYGRKGCVGVVVNSVHSPWFMGLLAGIEEELAPGRASLMLASLRMRDVYDAEPVMSWIAERRVDGLIFVRYSRREQPLFAAATEAGILSAFICPDETVGSGFTVRCRNFEAGRALTGHLMDLGHQRIAFIGGPKDSVDTLDRLRGLEAEMASRGVRGKVSSSFATSYGPEAVEDAARQFLKQKAGQRPSAVVLGNDVMALAFMRELLRSGVSIPDEVSVTGFDGIEEAARFWPALTTVAQPLHALGAAACRTLLSRIEDPTTDLAMTVEYAMDLVVRESSGPLLEPRGVGRLATRRR